VFQHPITSDELHFVSGLPDDLSDSLAALGEPETGEIIDLNGEQL
jgi:hypothetical protein